MSELGGNCAFHYVPLHLSDYARKHGLFATNLPLTDLLSGKLVRLPLWVGLEEHQANVIKMTKAVLSHLYA